LTFTSGINKDRPPVPGGAVAAAIAGSFGYFARDLSLELARRKGRQSAWDVRAGFRFLLGVQAHRAIRPALRAAMPDASMLRDESKSRKFGRSLGPMAFRPSTLASQPNGRLLESQSCWLAGVGRHHWRSRISRRIPTARSPMLTITSITSMNKAD
jgi:hypothetical protein